MLDSLHIRNIALIEEELIELFPGFSVLTGETGAGKSIIIGALNFVLGERVSGKELIRSGAEKASVEAIFSMDSYPPVNQLLEDNEIEAEDGTLILTRDLSLSGRSVCRVNGCVVPLSVLKQFGDLLVDIHGQHEHQSLLDVRTHLPMLDRFGLDRIENLLKQTEDAYTKAKSVQSALSKLDKSNRDRERNLDLFAHQINEIDAARLQSGEEEQLLQRKKMLMNAQKIIDALAVAKEAFTGEDGIIDRLLGAKRGIGVISDVGGEYTELADRISDTYYAIEDIADTVSTLFDSADFNDGELDEVEQRLELIHALERKYGSDIDEIVRYRASVGNQYEELLNAEQNRAGLAKEYETYLGEYRRYAFELSGARRQVGEKLSKRLLEELAGLGMPHASFEVKFTKLEGDLPSCTGDESVEFLLSANKGELPKPLAKVASGGEVSRIMLAFKRALAESDEIPTMVFDEIDTGISGLIGNAVAQKMQEIANGRQVVCITHLPQIAAAAEHQYHVFKTETETKTVSGVKLLTQDERAIEIARIMGSNPADSVAVEHARNLIRRVSVTN